MYFHKAPHHIHIDVNEFTVHIHVCVCVCVYVYVYMEGVCVYAGVRLYVCMYGCMYGFITARKEREESTQTKGKRRIYSNKRKEKNLLKL
jgi:hypothetical protein